MQYNIIKTLPVLIYRENFLLEHNMLQITMKSDSPHRKTYMCMYFIPVYIITIEKFKKKFFLDFGLGGDLKINFFFLC